MNSGGGVTPGTPGLMRTLNQGVLLERLRRQGPLSRAQLARETGLSKPTVSQVLAELENAGLVRAVGLAAGGTGRSGMLYEPDPTAGYVVGIDIGRSWIRVAAADIGGTVVGRRDQANRARTSAGVVSQVGRLARAVVADAGIEWERVVHTVVGSPGVFDPTSGRLWHAPNLPGWSRPGLSDELRDALTPTTSIYNDANLAAVGERDFGVGRDARNFVYLELGTGVGVGIVIDRELYAGAHGGAGEVGYIPLEGSKRSARGNLEEATAARAVLAAAHKAGIADADSAKAVFDAARAGDAAALEVVRAEAGRVAHLVATLGAVVDPEFVVLGGGIGASSDLLIPLIEARVSELSPLTTRVTAGELAEDAIVLGAIAIALDTARGLVFDQRLGVRPG
jgi:predicted NBD/HSP70 family sugar kinase